MVIFFLNTDIFEKENTISLTCEGNANSSNKYMAIKNLFTEEFKKIYPHDSFISSLKNMYKKLNEVTIKEMLKCTHAWGDRCICLCLHVEIFARKTKNLPKKETLHFFPFYVTNFSFASHLIDFCGTDQYFVIKLTKKLYRSN